MQCLNESNLDLKISCKDCQLKNKMPFKFCCLIECGEHEFCRACLENQVYKIDKNTENK